LELLEAERLEIEVVQGRSRLVRLMMLEMVDGDKGVQTDWY